MNHEFSGLQQLLDHIALTAQHRKRVSLEMVLRAVGQRSFAPLLLLAGLILFSPLSGVPGIPTTVAVLVLLAALQLLLGRRHFWLPPWILHRSISKEKLLRVLRFLGPTARFIDGWLRPRLQLLVRRTGTYLVALVCVLIALALPLMELVPFSAHIAGIALTAFGLALVAHDGLLALMAFVFTAFAAGMVAGALL